MTPRQTIFTALAALLLAGTTASAANAATEHRGHRTHAMHHGHAMSSHATPAASRRGSSQDHMADQLNAQSLQRTQSGAPQGAMDSGTGAMPAMPNDSGMTR